MGMGEPFLNTENVLAAVDGLMDERRFGLGGRRITISTCGVAPAIREMGARNVPVRLALSLNSPFQEQRERLMPVAKTWPLEEVLDACAEYIDLTQPPRAAGVRLAARRKHVASRPRRPWPTSPAASTPR